MGPRLISENRKNLGSLWRMMNSYRDMAVLPADTGQRVENLTSIEKGIVLALAGRIRDADNAMTRSWAPRTFASAAAVLNPLCRYAGRLGAGAELVRVKRG